MANRTVKISPKVVLQLVKDLSTPIDNMMKHNKDLFQAIQKMAEGDKDGAYWQGNRARMWFASAIRNCANNYYRVYKMSEMLCSLIDAAAQADQQDNDRDYTTSTSLNRTYYPKYDNYKNVSQKNYNAILEWAKK